MQSHPTLPLLKAVLLIGLLVGCAAGPSTPGLLPTRVIAPGAASEAAVTAASAVPVITVPVATGAAPAATLPLPAAMVPRNVNAISKTNINALQISGRSDQSVPRAFIAQRGNRALTLQSRSFVLYDTGSLQPAVTIPFTISASGDLYWYTGNLSATRAAVMQADGAVTVWDASSARVVNTLSLGKVLANERTDIALLPDGESLLHINDEIQIIEVSSGRQTGKLGALPTGTRRIAISLDAGSVAAMTATGIQVISTMGKPAITLPLPAGALPIPETLQIAPDGGRISLGITNGALLIWDTRKPGDAPASLQGAAQIELQFSPPGSNRAAAADGAEIALLRLDSGDLAGTAAFTRAAPILALGWMADGGSVLASSAHGLARFDAGNGQLLGFAGRLPYGAIAFNPGNSQVALYNPRAGAIGLTQLDALSGAERRDIDTLTPVLSAVYSPRGDLLLAMQEGGAAQIWDAASGALKRQITPPNEDVVPLCLADDARAMLMLDGRSLLRYGLEGNGAPARISLPFTPTQSGGCSRNGLLMLAADKRALVLDGSGRTVIELMLDESAGPRITRMAISPDATLAVVATATQAHVYELASGKKRHSIGLRSLPLLLRFSPDGRRVALAQAEAAGNPRIDVLDTATGSTKILTLRDGALGDMFWSPEGILGSLLLLQPAGSPPPRSLLDYRSSEITFWDVDAASALRTLNFDSVLGAVRLHDAGHILATSTLSGELAFWTVK